MSNEYAPIELDSILAERERASEAVWDAAERLSDARLALAAINERLRHLRALERGRDE